MSLASLSALLPVKLLMKNVHFTTKSKKKKVPAMNLLYLLLFKTENKKLFTELLFSTAKLMLSTIFSFFFINSNLLISQTMGWVSGVNLFIAVLIVAFPL